MCFTLVLPLLKCIGNAVVHPFLRPKHDNIKKYANLGYICDLSLVSVPARSVLAYFRFGCIIA